MPRELTQSEISDFLTRVPQAAADIQGHERAPGDYDFNGPLRFDDGAPRKAYRIFPEGYYVLVWLDASRRWHFIDLRDMPNFAAEVNKPPYVSPDAATADSIASMLGITQIGQGVQSTVATALDTIKTAVTNAENQVAATLNIGVKGVVLIALFAAIILGLAVWRGLEVPGLKVG